MIELDALSKELGVSASTIRRDVNDLEARNLVRRTHGGVVWLGDDAGRETGRPYAFEQRLAFRLKPKQRIAAAAAKLVHAGETILLDGGTTTYYLARALVGMPLQLVTNSLPIATLFQNDEHAELILVGGLVYPRYGVTLGPAAEQSLASIHTRTLFLSVAGMHRGELFNQNMLLVQAEQQMMAQSQKTVLLMDSSKFGQQALVKLCDLSKIDVIVTDSMPAPAFEKEIADAGCQLIVGQED